MVLTTTFSQEGYIKYGKRWIESVKNYWPSNTDVVLYVDFTIPNLPSNFTIQSFEKNFGTVQKKFKNRLDEKYKNTTEKNNVIGKKSFIFSYKSFVILDQLCKDKEQIFVWLDGDVETTNYVYEKDLNSQLNNRFLACQTEKQNYKFPHIESGILIFDNKKQETNTFKTSFWNYYTTDDIFKLKKPYDGYVIGRILVENNLNFTDFNKNILTTGKKSHKDETFLNPFLKNHFVHWIGDVKN